MDLKSNNSREWFGANKEVYTDLKMKFEEFVAQLILEFGEFENLDGVLVKNCTYRINRDVRFTKNKDPAAINPPFNEVSGPTIAF